MTTQTEEVKPADMPPIKFDTTEAKVKVLVKKYSGLKITDTKTDKAVRSARKDLVTIRTGVPKTLSAWFAPFALARDEAKALGDKIIAITKPGEAILTEVITTWENKKEIERQERARLENERIESIKTKVQAIIALGGTLDNLNAEELLKCLEEFKAMVIDDTFAEFQGAAGAALGALIANTETKYQSVKEQEEREEANRKEAARLKAEREEMEERQRKMDERQREIDRKEVEQRRLDAERMDKQESEKETPADSEPEKTEETVAEKVETDTGRVIGDPGTSGGSKIPEDVQVNIAVRFSHTIAGNRCKGLSNAHILDLAEKDVWATVKASLPMGVQEYSVAAELKA